MHGKTETRVGIFVLIALAIFVYMGFRIGSFRFDTYKYAEYQLSFKDISGLSRKADVKIAGVTVGWVEDIQLIANAHRFAKATVMVHRDYNLYDDAYGLVRQEGFLGPKYVEIVPGDPDLKIIPSGTTLREPSMEPVSVDELMRDFKHIADNVRDVTDAFTEAVGTDEGSERLRSFVEDLSVAADNISSFSTTLNRAFTENEEHVDALLQLGTTISRVADTLQNDVLPGFQSSIERISDVFDRDFDRIASNVEIVTKSFDDVAIEARDGLHSVRSIANKIDEGQGLIGKLINEDETYRDLKVAVEGIKNYVTKLDRLQIVIDAHSESMHRPAENYEFEDTKGYLEARIYPREDFFFAIQYVQSEKGFVKRIERQKDYLIRQECDPIFERDRAFFAEHGVDDNDGVFKEGTRPVFIKDLILDDREFLSETAGVRERQTFFNRDAGTLSVQIGKIFGNIGLRVGLFDGFAGAAADINVPFASDKFRWVTSLELYDFNGRNRINDRRPHFKWFNKMYFLRHAYVVFGADDFASKHNASAFYGVGMRFADDDIKYLMSSFSGLISGIGS